MQLPVQGANGQATSQVAAVPLFQNVLVLAIGQNTGGLISSGSRYAEKESEPSNNGGNTLVTLAFLPQEANLVAFVQEQGKLRLVLRSPADAAIEPILPASWDSFFQHIMPPKPASEEPVVVEDKTEYVEILRGLSKDRMPLSE
jgi:Flp pilus assembly protein CpaB